MDVICSAKEEKVLTKTYLVYCSSDDPSCEDPCHCSFEYLVQAGSADEAEAKCKERLASLPTDGEPFEKGTRIWVDYIIEIGAVPPEGAILRWVRYRGEMSSISRSLPLDEGEGTLASFLTEDPDVEAPGPREPFAVIGG